ncbi:hypothetical protein EKO27_g6017 [Xylaria grammica]|uniref:C2H2-type domain-containing protein n=1 Tax=Xylaria grammica TaxID=363999 RepID=A0A439D3W4_9PEZI|nr:hypothetical protein EKO27_g6017 [Xylaria grammica]
MWSNGYGIADGLMDEVFAKSRSLRCSVIHLLASIATTLTDRLLVLQVVPSKLIQEIPQHTLDEIRLLTAEGLVEGDESDDGASLRDDSSDSDSDDLAEVALDLETDTICLVEMDPVLKSPVLDTSHDKEKGAHHSSLLMWSPHQSYCERIESRFPQAENRLVLRLGRANYERFMRCRKMREAQEERDAVPDSRESVPLVLTQAKTVYGSSNFHDSALGSSLPTTSSYAETIMSYGGKDGNHTRIPPLPVEGRAGQPFTCIACGRSVLAPNNSAWKQHLYEDLCPWLCIDPSCPLGEEVYDNRNDWIAHLALDHGFEPHWDQYECPLCKEKMDRGKATIIKHLGGHLEEIALGALPPGLSFESESEDQDEDEEDYDPGDFKDTEEGATALVFGDPAMHMLTYQDRPEKCPIETCEYHKKGFTRKYDKNRHVLNHYKGTMVCPFCPGLGTAYQKAFSRADVLKRHLTAVHNVEKPPPNGLKIITSTSGSSSRNSESGPCSICQTRFSTAQEFYKHLDDCILNVIVPATPKVPRDQAITTQKGDKNPVATVFFSPYPLLNSERSFPEDERDNLTELGRETTQVLEKGAQKARNKAGSSTDDLIYHPRMPELWRPILGFYGDEIEHAAYGVPVSENEGHALLFLQNHPFIPSPKLYAMYREANKLYLVMSQMPGIQLSSVWDDLSEEEKLHILVQLRATWDYMRSIPSPLTFSGLDGGPLRHRFFRVLEPDPRITGPFDKEEELNQALALRSRKNWEGHQRRPRTPEFFARNLGKALVGHTSVLTHGNPQRKNILVEQLSTGDAGEARRFRVSAILDWEEAGWYPSYWEYAACFVDFEWHDDWTEKIEQIIDPYPLEAAMLRVVRQDLDY